MAIALLRNPATLHGQSAQVAEAASGTYSRLSPERRRLFSKRASPCEHAQNCFQKSTPVQSPFFDCEAAAVGKIFISGVAQWLACWAHNPKVRGSKPRSATFSFAAAACAQRDYMLLQSTTFSIVPACNCIGVPVHDCHLAKASETFGYQELHPGRFDGCNDFFRFQITCQVFFGRHITWIAKAWGNDGKFHDQGIPCGRWQCRAVRGQPRPCLHRRFWCVSDLRPGACARGLGGGSGSDRSLLIM